MNGLEIMSEPMYINLYIDKEDEDFRRRHEHHTKVVEGDVNFLITNFLYDYSYKWEIIGLALGFRDGEVRIIDSDVRGNVNRGLRELLIKWSHWPIENHEEEPTLEKLRDALCTQAVGLGDVATCLYKRRNELPSQIQ